MGRVSTNPMTSDVVLRDVTEEDLPIFFRHQMDSEASRMAAFTPRENDAFLQHWRTKILSDEAVAKKTVLYQGEVAGNVLAFEHDGKREVGYWIGREFWGKGVATRALAEFLIHETARPLYAGVAKHNVASIRVLEKCGFRVLEEAVRDDGFEEVLLELESP
jgi:RimJ/RimL family protein N-acetyltransferase